MGNFYSSQPVEQNSNTEDNSELKIFNEQNTDIINNQETQTSQESEYQTLLNKYNKLENEKNELHEEFDLLTQKYNNLITSIIKEKFQRTRIRILWKSRI